MGSRRARAARSTASRRNAIGFPPVIPSGCHEQDITRCWRLYEARNRELAHLSANVLLLSRRSGAARSSRGESLKTLKSTGRGKGVRGKWRNWRNNATIRGEIWHILRYKSHLLGIRFRSEKPRGTSHTCPRCGKEAATYRSPRVEHRRDPVKWGRWLLCAHCDYNADRDYAAAVNIARLGVTFVTQMQATGKAQAFSVTERRRSSPSAICRRARCCCCHRGPLGAACCTQARSTSMVGANRSPFARRTPPPSCYGSAGRLDGDCSR